MNLVMEGGSQFNVTDPIVIVSIPVKFYLQCSDILFMPSGLQLKFFNLIYLQGNANLYCLGVVKSGDVNIIGREFLVTESVISEVCCITFAI